MRIALYVVAVIVVIVLVVAAIGYALPQDHVASVSRTLPAQARDVFSRITNVADYSKWRADVERVEILAPSPLKWREHSGGDVITFEMVEVVPIERVVTRIADPDLPFGGTWTYQLRSDDAGTLVTLTERGKVYNPVFRFMSRFVFGHTASMERVLAALGA